MKSIILLTPTCLFIFGCVNNSKQEDNISSLTIKSTGSIDLGNKELYIQEQDTSYHIYSNWDGYYDLDNGGRYVFINDSCYNNEKDTVNVKLFYDEDGVNVKFISYGNLNTGNKQITIREVDTTYTFCVSKSDSQWSVVEDNGSGIFLYEYRSVNNTPMSINEDLIDFYSRWFSKENGNSKITLDLESNTLKYIGILAGKIVSFDMTTLYNEKEVRLRSSGLGGKLTNEMVEVLNELPKYFNVGDTTKIVIQNINMSSGEGLRRIRPSVIEIIF